MVNRIIHIANDEKFINSAYCQFESVFQKQNTFYIITNSETKDFVHVKSQESVFKVKFHELDSLIDIIQLNDLVIFHSLPTPFYSFLLKLPKKVKTIWMCFGFEVYNDIRFFSENRLLGSLTQKSFSSESVTYKYRFKEEIRPFYRIINPDLPFSGYEIKKKAFKRIDYLGTSFKEEFSAIQKLIGKKKLFFPFWYYPLEHIISISEEIIINKPNVLVGNSGFKSGNHLDVFAKIKSFQLAGTKVIVPLSYGNKEYIDIITKMGRTQFGDSFEPLLDFMPIEKYNEIVKHCGIAIFNNRRQQAVGNTIALLWFGSKVFLSSHNPFYQYLRRIGILVYCYETELTKQSIHELLSLEQIEYNRTILFQLLNQNKLLKKLEKQINVIVK